MLKEMAQYCLNMLDIDKICTEDFKLFDPHTSYQGKWKIQSILQLNLFSLKK